MVAMGHKVLRNLNLNVKAKNFQKDVLNILIKYK